MIYLDIDRSRIPQKQPNILRTTEKVKIIYL